MADDVVRRLRLHAAPAQTQRRHGASRTEEARAAPSIPRPIRYYLYRYILQTSRMWQGTPENRPLSNLSSIFYRATRPCIDFKRAWECAEFMRFGILHVIFFNEPKFLLCFFIHYWQKKVLWWCVTCLQKCFICLMIFRKIYNCTIKKK